MAIYLNILSLYKIRDIHIFKRNIKKFNTDQQRARTYNGVGACVMVVFKKIITRARFLTYNLTTAIQQLYKTEKMDVEIFEWGKF